MPLTSPPPRRRQSRDSIRPRLDATSVRSPSRSSAAKSRASASVRCALALAPDAPLSANASTASPRCASGHSPRRVRRCAWRSRPSASRGRRCVARRSRRAWSGREEPGGGGKGAEESERVLDEMRGAFRCAFRAFPSCAREGDRRERPRAARASTKRETRRETRRDARIERGGAHGGGADSDVRASSSTSEGPSLFEIARRTRYAQTPPLSQVRWTLQSRARRWAKSWTSDANRRRRRGARGGSAARLAAGNGGATR